VAVDSDVVITMLPDSSEVLEVYLGKEGLLSGVTNKVIFIDSSTVEPETTRKVGAAVASKGASMLDSPVGRGVPNAVKGNLIMLVGGEKEVLEECRDILLTIGDRIIHAGSLGSGETLKLINNMVMGIFLFSLVEGFSLALKCGFDQDKLMEMLKENLLSFYERHTTSLRKKEFQPGFRVRLGLKDLELALKMADSNSAFLPFAALTKEMLSLAKNYGAGEYDWTAVWSLYNPESQLKKELAVCKGGALSYRVRGG
jgi:3-hydroxyisobutyrate dehydrogenase-like beta-hydroxyacid dehydrogenase